MTETFTASNGWNMDESGQLCDSEWGVIDPRDVEDIRQFFQELRDHELGRWRDPENPDYVVYPVGDDVVDVLRESSVSPVTPGPGRQASVTREDVEGWDRDHSQSFYAAAHRYFEAHPQHKPLPTKPGLYGYRGAFDTRGCSYVLELTVSGGWVRANGDVDERVTAQAWHDAGELVRLVPEGGDDE